MTNGRYEIAFIISASKARRHAIKEEYSMRQCNTQSITLIHPYQFHLNRRHIAQG